MQAWDDCAKGRGCIEWRCADDGVFWENCGELREGVIWGVCFNIQNPSAIKDPKIVVAESCIPRSPTWDALQSSRNQAAVATLTCGLDSQISEIRQLSLKSLLSRPEPQAISAIISHWEKLDESDKELVRQAAQRLVECTKQYLAAGSLQEKRAALAAVADLDLHDSIDILLEIALDERHALCFQARDCLLVMCSKWGKKARSGKDSPMVRGKMLERLYSQVAKFHEHRNIKIIDAWLCLAHWDDSAQRGLISDPRHAAYRTVQTRLAESNNPAITQLLAGYLWRKTTPASVIEILTERKDFELAHQIAKTLDQQTLPLVLKRLRDIPPISCLENLRANIQQAQVSSEVERRLWLMLAASSDDLIIVLRGAIQHARMLTPEAQTLAASMVKACRHAGPETLVPALQSAAVNSPDDCLGNQVLEIAGWLNGPNNGLATAAREFFRDFTLANLLTQVRHWPAQMCRAMAQITKLVEPDVVEVLSHELQSPAPKRRLAALQVTQLLGCANEVSDVLLPLLQDPRLEVRVRVIDLLSALGFEPLETMIPELLADASTDIQDAANRAIRRSQRTKQSPPSADSLASEILDSE